MYKYRMSVIVPVYNSEKYLEACLDSLIAQTMRKDCFEVLLIDDGSSDASAEICRSYAEKCAVFKYIHKENGGVSSARNLGIQKAQGKYFLFLDADDTLSHCTLKAVAGFFDRHYDEVDLVTYKIVPIINGKRGALHYRYKTLNRTAVYDLNEPENWYITQSTMNTCVKNLGEGKNILFDTDLFWGEDQKYNCTVIADKMKIGYCDEAEYLYLRHPSSVTGTKNSAYYIFESTTQLWESIFKRFEGSHIPPYMQAMVLNDYNWKGAADLLLPYHYPKKEYEQAVDRVLDIISQFDDDVIVNHPRIDIYHKTYLLGLKKGSKLECSFDDEGVHLFSSGNQIYSSENITVAVNTFKVIGDKLCFDGFIKSPVLLYTQKPQVYMTVNGVKSEIEVTDSACDYYRSKMKTAQFWRIRQDFDINAVNSFSFEAVFDGVSFCPVYYFLPSCAFIQGEKHRAFFLNSHRFSLKNGEFKISGKKLATSFISRFYTGLRHFAFYMWKNPKILGYRLVGSLRPKRETWLYLDRYGVFDNAYTQFKHDAAIIDGIDRYYVINECDLPVLDEKFTPEEKAKTVVFQSYRHKKLYLGCDKIITSFSNLSNICPFGASAMRWYAGITRYELVYLQHGILHASLLSMYSKERSVIDRVVVSSRFEEKNFTSKYGYAASDLISSGMPRYDDISCEPKQSNRILFSPSWRSNLVGKLIDNAREPLPEIFETSDFFRQVSDLLNSPELVKLLEENDLYLDFKNHPIFECYNDMFTVGSDRITVSCGGTNIDEYALMITDYSSIVFDAVYMNCPIIYFVPDYDKFIAGVSHNYRSLDLPLEEGFGPLTQTAQELIKALGDYIDCGFKPSQPYDARMADFFLHRDNNCCDRLYDELRRNCSGI